MFPGLFLDRDGVIIHNRSPYVLSWEQVEFLPGSLEALARLKTSPYKIVVVSNQAGIGHGFISQATVDDMNHRMVAAVEAAGGRLDGVYVCPHRPEDGCACRKPQPGLLIRAARELAIDISRSVMIGDMLSDIRAGQAAGVAQTILVRTGNGAQAAGTPLALELPPFLVYENLALALSALAGIPSE